MRTHIVARCLASGFAIANWPAHGQGPLDRSDPTNAERALPRPEVPVRNLPVPISSPAPSSAATELGTVHPLAIVIEGAVAMPATAFTEIIASFSGRTLSQANLADLANKVAQRARDAGYPFASAAIPRQSLDNGVLRVTLDEGTIAAVRVVGASSVAADRVLASRLATGKPVTKAVLERAILLVEDLPGITVEQSQYVRQDGFGILLVTIERDHASGYLQIDNRGSREVGPVRTTGLVNIRGVAHSADELSLVLAQTPLEPEEFVFVRGRYALPVGDNGATIGASASYGDVTPGAALKPFHVKSRSSDFGLVYRRSLVRSRGSNLALTVEIRRVHVQQDIAGVPLRDEKLTLLNASLEAIEQWGGGALRAEARINSGIALGTVSEEGNPRLSRRDGDARFVTLGYSIEWQRSLTGRLGLSLSSNGQLATRPLLALAEIGVGGPSFARAYDYAERSGDQGILGSAELQYNFRTSPLHFVQRAQFYVSVDGGAVSNLRGGAGGGTLVSSSIGFRLGRGRTSVSGELAVPLNADRFDTGAREPRISLRIARVF